MTNQPKLHHYVPRFYMRNFSNEKGRLWVLDKSTRRIFEGSPEVLAAEKHFYRVPFLADAGFDALTLEKQLSGIEGGAATILRTWLAAIENAEVGTKIAVTTEDRSAFAFFLALQHLRTLESKEILTAFAQQSGAYPDGIDANEQTNLHVNLLWDEGGYVDQLASHICSGIWLFARNASENPFITSDNPVCFKTGDNRMWLKASGIFNKGVYLVVPLSPHVILYCKERAHWQPLSDLDFCVSPVQLDRDMVDHENSGQAFMSSRFLMSRESDFSKVSDFISGIEDRTHIPSQNDLLGYMANSD